MRDLGEVIADLVAARSELELLSGDDTAARLEVTQALDRLRDEAAQIRRASYPEEMARQWRTELGELRSAWERLAAERIDVVKQSGGGSQGGDFGFAADATRINRAIDADRGRDEIEARIRELRSLLEDLET